MSICTLEACYPAHHKRNISASQIVHKFKFHSPKPTSRGVLVPFSSKQCNYLTWRQTETDAEMILMLAYDKPDVIT